MLKVVRKVRKHDISDATWCNSNRKIKCRYDLHITVSKYASHCDDLKIQFVILCNCPWFLLHFDNVPQIDNEIKVFRNMWFQAFIMAFSASHKGNWTKRSHIFSAKIIIIFFITVMIYVLYSVLSLCFFQSIEV